MRARHALVMFKPLLSSPFVWLSRPPRLLCDRASAQWVTPRVLHSLMSACTSGPHFAGLQRTVCVVSDALAHLVHHATTAPLCYPRLSKWCRRHATTHCRWPRSYHDATHRRRASNPAHLHRARAGCSCGDFARAAPRTGSVGEPVARAPSRAFFRATRGTPWRRWRQRRWEQQHQRQRQSWQWRQWRQQC